MDINKKIEALREQMALSKSHGTQSIGTWFLGPKGESHELLLNMITEAFHHAIDGRESTYPNDPEWANPESAEYKAESKVIMSNYKQLVRNLEVHSVPFSSYRYQGHMLWDQSLPSVAGYFAAMLYNQNNVAAEASPLTTALEIEVANELCEMVGYGDDDLRPWGHITCDGSMANIEAMWSARNTKLYPFAVLAAFIKEDELAQISHLAVQVTGKDAPVKKIIEMDWWELMNLTRDVILTIPTSLHDLAKEKKIKKSVLENLIQKYTVQDLGLMGFASFIDEILEADGKFREALANMKLVGPATMHYSLPKAATLLGLGSASFAKIQIQSNARMEIDHLEKVIEEHLTRKIPVITVVAVMGTTEESAVDDLSGVLDLREKMRDKGMDFFVHADGAWGGYFASILNDPIADTDAYHHLRTHKKLALGDSTGDDADAGHLEAAIAHSQLSNSNGDAGNHEKFIFTPNTGLNAHTSKQLSRLKDADTITVDPHKSGFTLYPAGSLLYKDHRMPEMIQITARVVYHHGDAPTTGVFGVEGSKPGAAAAGVYFSHRIIKPDQSGYGRILGRCTFNTKRFFAQMMAIESDYFKLAALTDLEPHEIELIKEWALLSNVELWERLSESKIEFDIFKRTGPDLNIISYALNPIINGKLNKDPKVTNHFNDKLFKKLSNQSVDKPLPEVIVTSSSFDAEDSSNAIQSLRNQLGVHRDDHLKMNFLITTVMNPWLTDADQGKRNMIPEVVGYLQNAAEDLVKSMQETDQT